MKAPGRRPSSGLCDPTWPEPGSDVYFVVGADDSCANSSDDSFPTPYVHADADQHLNGSWQQQICSRSKLYHPKAFSAFYSFAFPLPTYNSPRQDAGNLRAPDGELPAANNQHVLLIYQTRFFFSRHEKLARFIGNFHNFSGDRRAIDVDVEGRKENTNQ